MVNRDFIEVISYILIIIFIYYQKQKIRKRNKNKKEKSKKKLIDLHLHLDGAITLDIAKKLAKLQNISLPSKNDSELLDLLSLPDNCDTLSDFLKSFDLAQSLLQTPEAIAEAVRLVSDNILSQGVIYAEIRFSPQYHTNKGMTQEEVVKAALEGLKKTKLKANLILCFIRGENNDEENKETLELAKKYLVEDGGVVALDLAGPEELYSTSKFADLFSKVKKYNIPFTIHAGEADGPKSVKTAIKYGAKRIGHGVRINEDPEVMALVKKKNITLEMCPTSNKMTHAVENMSKYPLIDYLNEGIKVTLNTDDMAIERTTLLDEYKYMEKNFGLTPEQEKILLLNAIDAAFTTNEVKDALKKEVYL